MLAYISGSVDEELLLQNEYLAAENRILKNQIKGRLQLADAERINLAESGRRLGRKALEEVAQIVRPETMLGWHRKLIAMKFDGSKNRSAVGRAPTASVVEELVLQFARENRSWATGGLLVPSAIWATKSATRPWRTFSSGTTWLPPLNEEKECFGRSLSDRIRKHWRPWISSRPRCGRLPD